MARVKLMARPIDLNGRDDGCVRPLHLSHRAKKADSNGGVNASDSPQPNRLARANGFLRRTGPLSVLTVAIPPLDGWNLVAIAVSDMLISGGLVGRGRDFEE